MVFQCGRYFMPLFDRQVRVDLDMHVHRNLSADLAGSRCVEVSYSFGLAEQGADSVDSRLPGGPVDQFAGGLVHYSHRDDRQERRQHNTGKRV